MRVRITSHLRAYTDGATEVEAAGATVREVLADLEARYPGLRFRLVDEQDRVREHMRIAVDDAVVRDLERPLAEGEVVSLLAALSGG